MAPWIIEGVGYLASLLLGLSLMMNNDLRFRWLNTGGCFAFIVYGILISAIPIILTNAGLFFINVVALVKIYRKKENFELLEFTSDTKLIDKFLRYYEADFRSYFPHFRLEENSNDVRFVVLRNMELATVFVATLAGDGTAFVKCNYTIPKFRDYKVGRFIFEKEGHYLPSKGVRKLVYTEVPNAGHHEYLHRMGFEKEIVNGKEGMVKVF